jgi:hypothetical protein
MKPPNAPGDVENMSHVENPEAPSTWQGKLAEYTVRAAVVGAGIFAGMFLALVIGLYTGWIPFEC